MPKKSAKTTKPKSKKRESNFDERINDFSEEIERFGRKFEKKGDQWDTWFHKSFGFVGPLISSIFGIIVFAIIIWIIGIINTPLSNSFLTNVISFLSVNMAWFFLFFLFFSFTSYFSKAHRKMYIPFSPLFTAISISIGFWIVAHAIRISNVSIRSVVLTEISDAIFSGLFWIFLFFFFVGYLYLLVKINTGKHPHISSDGIYEMKRTIKKATRRKGNYKRLYRSGDDRIIGGVCGGVGEYLGIDPTIIRLIWILSFFAWGIGIIAYIVAWIIIPRNPDHVWND